MFGLFKKKTPLEKLQDRYNQLLKESFELSKTDRKKSDEKQMQANEILKQMEALGKA